MRVSSDRPSWTTALYESPTSPRPTPAGTPAWPETILAAPAALENLLSKVFLSLRFWLLYLPVWELQTFVKVEKKIPAQA